MLVGKRKGNKNFWWAIHNLIGHPVSEICYLLGFKELSSKIHDETIPIHDPKFNGRG